MAVERGRAPLRSDVWRALRPHTPFLVALLAGGILRLVTLLAYRPGLAYAQDSFDYLYDARTGVPNVVRPAGYSFFLNLVEDLTGQFWVVVGAQHVFGLLIGIMLYALLHRLGAGRWLATLGATPILLDSYQVYIEQFVLSETLFALLVTAAVVCLLWPSERWVGSRTAAAGLALGLATITRTVGIALILGTVVYLLLRKAAWRHWVSFALPVGLIVAAYGSWFHGAHGSYGLERYSGYTLAARVSPFADCRGLDLPPDEAIFCDRRPPRQRPGGDAYLWSENSPLRRRDGTPGPERERSAGRFGRRIIGHQPLDYLKTVAENFVHYFAPGDPVGRKDNSIRPLQFLTSYDPAPSERLYPPADPYNTNWGWPQGMKYQVIPARWGFGLKQQDVKVNAPLARVLRAYQHVGRTPGPFLALALLVAVAPALQPVGRDRRYLRTGALLLATLGVLVLVMPSAFGALDYRYRLPSLVLLPPAGALGLALVCGRIGKRRALQSSQPDAVRPQALRRPRTSPLLEPSLFDLEGAEAEVGRRSAGS